MFSRMRFDSGLDKNRILNCGSLGPETAGPESHGNSLEFTHGMRGLISLNQFWDVDRAWNIIKWWGAMMTNIF